MTRKDFITLTLTLVGGASVAAGCSSRANSPHGVGTGGATGAGGTTGAGTGGATGTGAGGATGTGAGGATGATDAAADSRADASSDATSSCADPLPSSQLADATGHTHTMTVPLSTLAATTTQTLLSGGFPMSSGAHFHQIMLTPANLTTLRGGGTVTVTSTSDGDPVHSHMFMVACQ